MSRPTLYLTNWSSRRLHGPGRRWTIMRKPRAWEHGDGRVPALVPRREDLEAAQRGDLDPAAYAAACREVFGAFPLEPGRLEAVGADGPVPVADGDTLCCACSREAAARGACHRVVAAALLADAGWRVVLDGAEPTGGLWG